MIRIRNGAVEPAADALALPSDRPGVFETVLWREGSPVFADRHWARFKAGCQWAGLGPPLEPAALWAAVGRVATANGIADGVVRFAAWRDTGGTVEWVVEVTPPRPHARIPEFRVLVDGARLPATATGRAFKHLGRALWLETLRRARVGGWDEALLWDNAGALVEGCVSNVFLVKDGILHTPPLDTGPLPGVLRQAVLDLARQRGLPVRELRCDQSTLAAATEIWLTNSLIGIRPVSELGLRRLPADRPFLDRFRLAWRQTHGWDPVVLAPS